jgi:hypothetical protein
MRFLRPRMEQARADWIAQREIIKPAARNHQSRNDMLARTPFVDSAVGGVDFALSGTAIAGGILESEVVTGSETLIITLTGDTWHPDVGSDNAITTALIAGITGDDVGGNGWNDEVSIAHGNVARTSATVVTITLPATAGYAIAADETVTVDIPGSALAKGIAPVDTVTFDVTNEA